MYSEQDTCTEYLSKPKYPFDVDQLTPTSRTHATGSSRDFNRRHSSTLAPGCTATSVIIIRTNNPDERSAGAISSFGAVSAGRNVQFATVAAHTAFISRAGQSTQPEAKLVGVPLQHP